MSLKAIRDYVNDLITSNRDQDAGQIEKYFSLMKDQASLMLNQLALARRLTGLESLIENKIVTEEQAKIIRNAVDLILSKSDNLGKDLNLLNESGLLSLQDKAPVDVYDFSYRIEPILRRASELLHDSYGWWKTLRLRNQIPSHYVDEYEKASNLPEVKEVI